MTTITNEYGTFTGETEAEALKAAKKGKREAAKRQEEESREYNTALTNAAESGFKILRRLVEDGTPLSPKGEWISVTSEHAAGIFQCYESDRTELQPAALCGLAEPVKIVHTGCTFRGVIIDGSGWLAAYMLTDDATGKDALYAVGTSHGRTFANTRVPGVTVELLAKLTGEKNSAVHDG